MEIALTPTNQTIHLSRAGRSGVQAECLMADQTRAAAIGAWVGQLTASAATLGIPLNTQDVRTLLPTSIEDLEDVIKKSHPDELRGYGGPLGPLAAQTLQRWCTGARVCTKALADAWLGAAPMPTVSAIDDYAFPTTLSLGKYQRMALGAFLQVGNDTLVILKSVLCLARRPYAPLFSSNLTPDDIACCETAIADLASLLRYGHMWVAETPIDRRRFMILEHLRDAATALGLLFEGTSGWQRKILAELLADLPRLKRRV